MEQICSLLFITNSSLLSKLYLKKPRKVVSKDSRTTKIAFNKKLQSQIHISQVLNHNQIQEKHDSGEEVVVSKVTYQSPPIANPRNLPQLTFLFNRNINNSAQ